MKQIKSNFVSKEGRVEKPREIEPRPNTTPNAHLKKLQEEEMTKTMREVKSLDNG